MAKRSKSSKPVFLIALVSVFTVLIFAFVVYNIVTPTYDYDDEQFVHFTNWQTDPLVYGSQEDDLYVVYLYLTTCGACQQIKQNILGFGANNDAGINLYLADASRNSLRDTAQFRPGTSTVVPTIHIMRGAQLVEEITGTQDILSALERLGNGTYAN